LYGNSLRMGNINGVIFALSHSSNMSLKVNPISSAYAKSELRVFETGCLHFSANRSL
jgi:hypothetical protein